MKFITTYGIEFTYLFNKKNRDDEDVADDLTNLIRTEFQLNPKFKQRIKNRTWPHVDNDAGAVEIQSPVFKNIKEVKSFYIYMDAIVSQYPLVSHRKDIGGGGGHIHFGTEFLKTKKNSGELSFNFHLNLYRDMQNRPYLNWIFNEYFDNESAIDFRNCYNGDDTRQIIFSRQTFKYLFDKYVKPERAYRYDSDGKKYKDHVYKRIYGIFNMAKGYQLMTNNSYKTIEVRIFDGKRNWQEVKDHLFFLNAYIKYILELTKDGKEIKVKVRKFDDIEKLVKDDTCIYEFTKLLRVIGLSSFDYMHYVDLNYKIRKKEGYII